MSDIKPGDLQTYVELIRQADVKIEDIDNAIAQWQENPPDDEFATILEAEIVEDKSPGVSPGA